ncbi:MAG: hypothetical protein DRP62_03875 [Planctomycetota bacterium]|nr:MAG: hypothetical protein DRP62_03875 [Planctomycetota bacterium]
MIIGKYKKATTDFTEVLISTTNYGLICLTEIGDLIIALETYPDKTLITTNAKESDVISPAIGQEYIVLKLYAQK